MQKFVLGKSVKIWKYLYSMSKFKGFPIIQESFMTWSEDWHKAFRYSTLPGKHCMCQNLHSHMLLPELKLLAPCQNLHYNTHKWGPPKRPLIPTQELNESHVPRKKMTNSWTISVFTKCKMQPNYISCVISLWFPHTVAFPYSSKV